jgi:hypothetical protein
MKYFKLIILLLSIFTDLSCCDKEEGQNICEDHCTLVPQVGPCNAALPRYYYDKAEKKCKLFTWGGCAGLVPFETLEACESCGCK